MNNSAQQILEQNILGVLATVNDDGSPWATPLHFVANQEALFWYSPLGAKHSLNLAERGLASVTIFSPDESDGLKAVYINGGAQLLDKSSEPEARQLFTERLGSFPESFNNFSAYKMPIGKLDSQKSAGKCWYFYN